MKQSKIQGNEDKKIKKKKPKDDILDVVKQFVNYFEQTDRGNKHDNRSQYS